MSEGIKIWQTLQMDKQNYKPGALPKLSDYEFFMTTEFVVSELAVNNNVNVYGSCRLNLLQSQNQIRSLHEQVATEISNLRATLRCFYTRWASPGNDSSSADNK